MEKYQVKVKTPIGVKKGFLTFTQNDNQVSGEITFKNHVEKITGTFAQNKICFAGMLHTGAGVIKYQCYKIQKEKIKEKPAVRKWLLPFLTSMPSSYQEAKVIVLLLSLTILPILAWLVSLSKFLKMLSLLRIFCRS